MSDLQQRVDVLERDLEIAHERIAQLEKELGVSMDTPLCLPLTQAEARILGVLMKRDMARKEALHLAVQRDDRSATEITDQKIVDVFVCKLRKKLEPFGFAIETLWGEGYRISPEDKVKINSLFDPQCGQERPSA